MHQQCRLVNALRRPLVWRPRGRVLVKYILFSRRCLVRQVTVLRRGLVGALLLAQPMEQILVSTCLRLSNAGPQVLCSSVRLYLWTFRDHLLCEVLVKTNRRRRKVSRLGMLSVKSASRALLLHHFHCLLNLLRSGLVRWLTTRKKHFWWEWIFNV